jgi:hypothetical protein
VGARGDGRLGNFRVHANLSIVMTAGIPVVPRKAKRRSLWKIISNAVQSHVLLLGKVVLKRRGAGYVACRNVFEDI